MKISQVLRAIAEAVEESTVVVMDADDTMAASLVDADEFKRRIIEIAKHLECDA